MILSGFYAKLRGIYVTTLQSYLKAVAIASTYMCELGFAQFCRNKTKCKLSSMTLIFRYIIYQNDLFILNGFMIQNYYKFESTNSKDVFIHWGSSLVFCFGKISPY